MDSLRKLSADSMFAFGLFGAFWGAWGGSIPRIQRQAGVDDGQLGFALLFVGAAALPAMILVGRAIDRYGLRVAGIALPALGVAGAVMSLTAHSLLSLSIGLAVIGAVSGASDVAINAVAGQAEVRAGGAVITRSHAAFSSLVVFASIGTGICASVALAVWAPFVFIAAISVATGVWLVCTLPKAALVRERTLPSTGNGVLPLLLLGILGALAFASENAHQSWSAVFAHDVLHTSTSVAAGAPAIFAAVVATTRFAIGRVPVRHAVAVIMAGGSAAAAGAALIAVAPDLGLAAVGLAVAAAGTAVLFPTLMRLVSRSVEPSRRGRATSLVTSISYLGFLLGPVYVGQWADGTGLRGAMVAVAGLALALVISARPLVRRAGMDPRAAARFAAPERTGTLDTQRS
jgi:MFS family permease